MIGTTDHRLYALGRDFPPMVGPSQQPPPQPATLYAIHRTDGSVQWTHTFDRARTAAVDDHGVYVATGHRLVAVGHDGARRWTMQGGSLARKVITVGGRIFYLRRDDNTSVVHGLTPAGEQAWQRRVRADRVVWAAAQERVFLGGDVLVALTPDGTVPWRQRTRVLSLLLDPETATVFTRTGRIAAAVGAYATDDGTRQFVYDVSANYAGPAVATADWLIVWAMTDEDKAPSSYKLIAVDRASGRTYSEFELESVFSAESLNGTVYVSGGNGMVSVLEPPER